uniref:Leucine-rich repeat-containing protein 57 n=1 Tax=Ditylenchus dipsaci TaxID=166011 RepID=A0A915D015_9BILA
MGNESSKGKHPSSSTPARATTSLPSFSLKSGPSSSIVQRHLEMPRRPEFYSLKDTVDFIRTLDLSQNKLRELPAYFDNFSVLKQLILADNKLVYLPDELGRLKTLELLNVSHNELTALPDTLLGCYALKTLIVSFNQISDFPLVIANLPNVECVDLSGNLIESIPEQLNMNRNRLNSIHTNLSKCPNLKVLRVDENCLQKNQFSKPILEESKISLITHAGNVFQDKDFQSLPGYETYQERFTATKRKGV